MQICVCIVCAPPVSIGSYSRKMDASHKQIRTHANIYRIYRNKHRPSKSLLIVPTQSHTNTLTHTHTHTHTHTFWLFWPVNLQWLSLFLTDTHTSSLFFVHLASDNDSNTIMHCDNTDSHLLSVAVHTMVQSLLLSLPASLHFSPLTQNSVEVNYLWICLYRRRVVSDTSPFSSLLFFFYFDCVFLPLFWCLPLFAGPFYLFSFFFPLYLHFLFCLCSGQILSALSFFFYFFFPLRH